jgi:hypothetical protein
LEERAEVFEREKEETEARRGWREEVREVRE